MFNPNFLIDIESLQEKNICYDCIGDPYLRDIIMKDGKEDLCAYCQNVRSGLNLDQLANFVEDAFERHYELTPAEPDSYQASRLADKEDHYEFEREGMPVVYAIMDAVDIVERAASDLQKVLEYRYEDYYEERTTEFSEDCYYELKKITDESWQTEWLLFEHSLQTKSRYFNEGGSQLLASIFQDISEQRTKSGRPIIVNVGPGCELLKIFRARVFQSSEDLQSALKNPEKYLGPPASEIAKAGRMNALGISVFYGSSKPNTALAEVRPPIGSTVVTSRFSIIRNLRLLDITAFKDIKIEGSIFDVGYAESIKKISFIKSLSDTISTPIMPNDEAFSYVLTQAIADYLASNRSIKLDGVIYSSVQYPEGVNIVLFQHAARVEAKTHSHEKSEVSMGYFNDEGWNIEYEVTEYSSTEVKTVKDGYPSAENWSLFGDKREVSLRLDRDCIQAEVIKSVIYKTDKFPVQFKNQNE